VHPLEIALRTELVHSSSQGNPADTVALAQIRLGRQIAATLKPALLDVAEKQVLHLIVKSTQVVILDLHGVRSSKMDGVILDRPLIATESSNQIPSG
jgi:hypothetical protein